MALCVSTETDVILQSQATSSSTQNSLTEFGTPLSLVSPPDHHDSDMDMGADHQKRTLVMALRRASAVSGGKMLSGSNVVPLTSARLLKLQQMNEDPAITAARKEATKQTLNSILQSLESVSHALVICRACLVIAYSARVVLHFVPGSLDVSRVSVSPRVHVSVVGMSLGRPRTCQDCTLRIALATRYTRT